MTRGKGKGPMGVRPDPESDSQSPEAGQPLEGQDLEGEEDESQSPTTSASADESAEQRETLVGRRQIRPTRVPVDQREPLQVDASLATGTRTSAATSHQGEDSREAAHPYGTGPADEATSRPADLGSLKDDVLAIKHQQAKMMEQLESIQTSQADMVHQLRFLSDVVTGSRHRGSTSVHTGHTPPPAPPFSDVEIPYEGNVGDSEVEVVFGATAHGQVAEDQPWVEVPAKGRERDEVPAEEADTVHVQVAAHT